jgi:phosphoglycolate phosphatase
MPDASAVLFDLDGTLLDTLGDIAAAMNAVLADWGLPVHPQPAYRRFIGDGAVWLARRVLPEPRRDEETVARCVEAFRRAYAERGDPTTRPYPGVAGLLDGLTARGLRLAVLSNKPHDFTVALVRRLLGAWPLEPVFGSRPGVPNKPDPTTAVAIAEQHGISPGDWLYLGDTATDMETAGRAGMIAVGVLWGFRGADELRAAGARHLVTRPDEALDLLGR